MRALFVVRVLFMKLNQCMKCKHYIYHKDDIIYCGLINGKIKERAIVSIDIEGNGRFVLNCPLLKSKLMH